MLELIFYLIIQSKDYECSNASLYLFLQIEYVPLTVKIKTATELNLFSSEFVNLMSD